MIITKIQLRLIALFTLLVFASTSWAQTENALHRYVKKTGGAYANDGKTWAKAKNNVQDAINDLHDYMVKAGITQGGKVFVAAGTYTPSETTETTGGSQLGMSFKMYAGITVEGGYPTDASEGNATKNATANKTIFSGNLTSTATFTWNNTKQQYSTQFPGNVYHVVWFATNGFDSNGRANALTTPATLDGIVIEGGRAYNTDLVSKHPHNAYGAGIYAVAGAEIINCEVLHCEASRDGAGIYLDGGGTVKNCHIHQCQTLGLGIKYGRGGAICIDGGGMVERSVMTNNVAREGGALAIYERGTCVASLLTNNTSTTEAGGAYLKDGGVLSGVSVMRNRCNGSGAVIDGITTGMSGGVFAVGPARIYNSALWGNQVGDNGNPATYDASPLADTYNDLQFSAYKAEGQQGSALYYVAMNNNDRVNWSHTSTRGMVSLATPNTGSEASLHYINLGDNTKNPSTVAGVISDENYHTTYNFKPKAISALVNKGIQLSDIPAEDKVGAEDAAITKDITNHDLSPLCDLGAYLAQTQAIAFADGIANHEGSDATTKTLFVDPNRSTTINAVNVGNSWDAPLANLRDALGYIREHKTDGEKYQILCKEGILYTSGTSTSERLAQSSIYMIDDVAVYGGYPSALTGTNLSNGNFQRDPVEYPTIISGSIISGDYDKNTAHLVNFSNVNNAILDGFQLRYGNASASSDNKSIPNAIDWGAGIIYTNMFEYNGTALTIATEPHHMYGNVVRNTIITGCTARSGAAIYTHMINDLNGELTLNNCILHNNSVIYGKDGNVIPTVTAAYDRSIIHVSEGVTLNMNHCDVLRNVGYGIYAANAATVNIFNSMFYANLDRPVDNTNEFDIKPSAASPKAKICAPIRKEGSATISGSNNMFDYLFSQSKASTHPAACFSADYFEAISMTGTNNLCNLTYSLVSNDNYTYPKFENPTRNSGVSPDGDVTFYGNATSFMPLNMNPMVNAAMDDDASLLDMTTLNTRDYGNASDIGALENTEQAQPGTKYFVRDYRNGDGTIDTNTDGRDGMSWHTAINGNGKYATADGGTPIGYRMKHKQTGKYISTTTTTVNGRPTLVMCDNANDAEVFNIAGSTTNIGNSSILATTLGLYINNGGMDVWMHPNARTFYIWSDTNGYYITKGGSDYLIATNTGTGDYLKFAVSNTSNENSRWEFEQVKSNGEIPGLQYAINTAKATNDHNHNNDIEVWVATGTYEGNFTMKEGVDVLGGFPAVGNPGIKERDLSHKKFPTVIDAKENGRCLTQENTFSVVTMFEGIELKNGKLNDGKNGSGAYLMTNGKLKNCYIHDCAVGNGNGGGVYSNGGLLESCSIRKNYLSSTAGNKGGAGAFLNNTNLVNCLIADNEGGTTDANSKTGIDHTANILGVGVGTAQGGVANYFYNCTIVNNIGGTVNNPIAPGVWDFAAQNGRGGGYYFNCIITGNYARGNSNENYHQLSAGLQPENQCKYVFNSYIAIANIQSCGGSYTYNMNAISVARRNDYKMLYPYGNASATVSLSNGNSITLDENGFFKTTGAANNETDITNFIQFCKDNSPIDYANNYQLKANSPCINKGDEKFIDSDGNITVKIYPSTESTGEDKEVATKLILVDSNGDERIQDCALDMGAYEYDGAADIQPTVDGTTATYYVTEAGTGTASAENAANAACSQKLQKVLDAAGRYKYANPTHKVKVLLGANTAKGTYSPRRTADQVDVENARSWSLMVPRGVEVYGGYEENTFAENTRNAITHKTILDGKYKRSQDESEATAYHVVTFTDRVFDPQGLPYLKDDMVFNSSAIEPSHYDTSNEDYTDADLLLLSTKINEAYVEAYGAPEGTQAAALEKAVLDGLFIQGGKADGVAAAGSLEFNPNCYGGAAIVPGFANVRNCILQNNDASIGGGALYLRPGAIVSGTLIKKNSAKLGGGIYFENNEDITDASAMAQVLTSTIVDNTATEKGGGIWFNWNAKINSSVIWGNTCGDQANVSGQTGVFPFADANVDTPFNMYPFAYSAVENNKYPGPNNQSVSSENKKGVRFASNETGNAIATDKANINDFYPLTDYSVLCKTGSSLASFQMYKQYGILANKDLAGVERIPDGGYGYKYMDIGARVYGVKKQMPGTAGEILHRLFVANPEDVNMTACESVKACSDATYNKRGSSFAYPMQSLDEALEYIIDVRKDATLGETAKDIEFEIVMAGGTYYPTRDPYDRQGICYSNTFLVPEGVTIVGGLNVGKAVDQKSFYGQIHGQTAGTTTDLTGDYKMEQETLDTIKARRVHIDNNANDIIEPWEFQYQTILSGQIINSNSDFHVYHVVTVVADENLMGKLPTAPKAVEFNGVHISGGQAYEYYKPSLDQGFLNYGYFVGGGVYVDGNWQGTLGSDPTYKNRTTAHATGNRDIPLIIDRCQFLGNEAGCGGAIATTSTLSVYNSSFENNLAWGDADKDVPVGNGENMPKYDGTDTKMSVNYPGFGGAIYGTSTITCLNTVFANNEATYGDITSGEKPISFKEPSEPDNTMLFIPGQGGAVYAGTYGQVQATNCDFVRNKAVAFPAIFLTSPNTYQMGKAGTMPTGGNYNKVFNSVFWGNEGTAKNTNMAFAKNLNINFAKHTGTPVKPDSETNVYAQYASSQSDLDANFAQGLWFCAYEKGTSQTPVNTLDVRKASIDLRSEAYVGNALKTYATTATTAGGLGIADAAYTPQDANVIISSDNAAIDGPNFTNPSHLAGNEGYMQDADWMPLRINLLTDGGWGYVKQETGTTDPDDKTGVVFTSGDINTNGIFSALQTFNSGRVAIKDENYMQSAADKKLIRRISKVPAPFHDPYDYVDIGVYEYQYQKFIQGDHVDFLWITENEDLSAGNDGSTWAKATSDVQRAIETLLSSRCGHDKYLLVKEGKYKPLTKYDKNLGYTINTGALNTQATTISKSSRGITQSVPSLTIIGGFSNEVETTFGGYDKVNDIISASNPETHPTMFYADDDDTNTLFNIVDARQWYATGEESGGTIDSGTGSTLKGTDNAVGVIPITIDGLTFHNPHGMTNGVAINYGDMAGVTDGTFAGEPIIKMTTSGSGDDLTTSVSATAASDHFPKLTLRRCIFHANGKEGNTTANVVKIGQGGGYALIQNSLFDNNNATHSTLNAFNTRIVNCTFADNISGVKLANESTNGDKAYLNSRMHGSILWNNNNTSVTGISAGEYMTYNAISTLNSDDNTNNNVTLSLINADVANGPNFVDPTNADIDLRDYHLKPSMKTLNIVPAATYYNNVTNGTYGTDEDMNEDSEKTAYWNTQTDLASNPRFKYTNIDRGAYEYQQELQRIIFYDPNRVTSGDGTDWEHAYGYKNLQNAIDLVSISATKPAYVFAKGGKDGRKTDEAITLRNGVEVMGSINPSETVSSIDKSGTPLEMKDVANNRTGTAEEISKAIQADIDSFIQNVIANKRPGLLCPSTSRTIIDGLTTQGTYNAQTSIDNIYVEGNLNVTATANPSDATANVLLRNMVVTGGTASIQGAIAYNTLFFDNKDNSSASAPSLAANAYAIHCTSEQAFTGTPVNAKYCNTSAFAFRSWDSYPALNYQLPYNDANCIDMGEASFDGVKSSLPAAVSSLSAISNIDFALDRDLLGNSRLIGDKADCGAFEAWRIAENTTVTAHAANEAYPHEGTNVIIEEGASLVLDNDLKAANIGFIPGYLHVMKGGSLYAQNNNVTAANVSVQMMINKEGSVVSLPYNHDYSAQGTAYIYDSKMRSEHDYDFSAANSECWKPVTDVVPANTGVLFVPNSSDWGTDETRSVVFNSKGANPTDWVYTESSDELYRTITLTQHNGTPSDGSADFTSKEDMGWNCIGLPYLVSNYKPYEQIDPSNPSASGSTYRMNIPHTLWLYYNGTVSPDGNNINGEGGFYSVNSWEGTPSAWHVSNDSEASLWTGEGIFLQTATLAKTEELTFYRPAYVTPSSAPARRQSATRYYTDNNLDELDPDGSSNAELIATEYYTAGGARIAAPLHHGVTIIRNRYSDGTSRTSKVFHRMNR